MTATLAARSIEKGLLHHINFKGIVIYFRKTLNVQIILQIGFSFFVVLVLVKTTGQPQKGPPATAGSLLSPTYSQPLTTNASEKSGCREVILVS